MFKIVYKMLFDFLNFMILYLVVALTAAQISSMNFMFYLPSFDTLGRAFITVFDVSLYNFDFDDFKVVSNGKVYNGAVAFVIVLAFILHIILINLLIAILANTYQELNSKSNGLYLSMILMHRDELSYDRSYGSLLASVPPFNVVQIPFLPLALWMKQKHPAVIRANDLVMRMQYILFMLFPFTIFSLVSVVLIPVAYLVSLGDKLLSAQETPKERLHNCAAWALLGIPVLCGNTVVDLYLFWVDCFRPSKGMKLIMIPKDPATITHQSIRRIINVCKEYSSLKIKSLQSTTLVRVFKSEFEVV